MKAKFITLTVVFLSLFTTSCTFYNTSGEWVDITIKFNPGANPTKSETVDGDITSPALPVIPNWDTIVLYVYGLNRNMDEPVVRVFARGDSRETEMRVSLTVPIGSVIRIRAEIFYQDELVGYGCMGENEEGLNTITVRSGINRVTIDTYWINRPTGVYITIKFWDDENVDGKILSSNNNFTISNSNNGVFTARVYGGYDNIEWLMWGVPLIGNDDGFITIHATDFNPGTYQLTVIVLKDGIPYSAEIIFIVID
jgi:hypothetical protein